MKKSFTRSALLGALLLWAGGSYAGSLWTKVQPGAGPSESLMRIHPKQYTIFTLNESWLKPQMFSLSSDPQDGMVIELPQPDGTMRSFVVWEDPMMHDKMAAKYPDIKTFTAHAVGDQTVTAKLDFTVYGFHAMVFDGENTLLIDPCDLFHDGYYMVRYRRDEQRAPQDRMKCEFKDADEDGPAGEAMATALTDGLPKLAQRTANGWTRKDYDLALSANHFYTQAATGMPSPTMAQALSAMTTTMNRVNGVYEREFAVHMNFIANEDTLIWRTHPDAQNGNDPFNSINNNGAACLTQNQTTVTARVGSANYDCGHVFTTGGGGISGLGIVCNNSQKAQSVTGLPNPVGDAYDIDYVAHEMGHEFGSNHTFGNNNDGSCSGNRSSTHSYEPGSGTTIMAYAGICSPDDLAMHSEAYFHASSLLEIQAKLVGSENVCATPTATGNKLVYLTPFTATYSIPYKTPFELTAPTAVDSVADTAKLYCWEQYNLTTSSGSNSRFVNTFVRGAIFRSWFPVKTETRIFPRISKVLAGTLSDAGVEGNQGEKAPDTARFLTFRLTMRNIRNGNGCFLFSDDSVHLDAIQTTTRTGFKVTSQNTTGISYAGGSSQTVTWDVVGTNAAPVNAANVVIWFSKDGGLTWPVNLGTFPNTGTATVSLPNPFSDAANCRIKVKGSGNVFFNVNSRAFKVTRNSALPSSVNNVSQLASVINIYPVPATDMLNITADVAATVKAVVYNNLGQVIWQGDVNNAAQVSVGTWARGVYHMQLINTQDGDRAIKSFILQ